MSDEVPERFRPALRVVLKRIVEGDFDGLVRDGFVPAGGDPGVWVRNYPLRLVPFPPEAWRHSRAGRIASRPGCWWVVVPLRDQEGTSDLSLEATVCEGDGQLRVEVDNIHVL